MLLWCSRPARSATFWWTPVAPARVRKEAVTRFAIAGTIVVMRSLDKLLEVGCDAFIMFLKNLVVVIVFSYPIAPVECRALSEKFASYSNRQGLAIAYRKVYAVPQAGSAGILP